MLDRVAGDAAVTILPLAFGCIGLGALILLVAAYKTWNEPSIPPWVERPAVVRGRRGWTNRNRRGF